MDPNDPKANLAAGRFYCFVRNDWDKGLTCLAKCSNAALKRVAESDLNNPSTPEVGTDLGDAWLVLAQRERDPFVKARYQLRATGWYNKALALAKGVLRIKLEKKLEDLPPPLLRNRHD